MALKGIVGSDIPLVATFSFWETSWIWVHLVVGPSGRGHSLLLIGCIWVDLVDARTVGRA